MGDISLKGKGRAMMATGGRADNMPAKNKKNFRPTKSGAGMTRAGVMSYRRMNPGSKLSTKDSEMFSALIVLSSIFLFSF